jgi:hypothetical protein
MPVLGISQNKFKIGQQHNFQVFGDQLNSSSVAAMATNVPNVIWQNISTPGKGQKHLNVQATLTSTAGAAPVSSADTIGDLTITVTDAGTNPSQTATTTFSPVTYQGP